MTNRTSPRWGGCVVAACVLVLGLAGRVEAGATIFELAEGSTAIAFGRVTGVRAFEDGQFQVFSIVPDEVVRGDLAAGEPFELVQERLFETSEPYFAKGVQTLIFAKPLPPHTLYKKSLPEGSYLQWSERLDTASEVATLRDPALVAPVRAYLTTRKDPEASARLLGPLTASTVPRLREGSLAALEKRRELSPLLDQSVLAPLDAFVADPRVPVASRADTLVRLARLGAPGIVPVAEKTAAQDGPLLPAAVDALVTLDRLPSEERLLAYSRADDEALRIAAVRGLAKTGSPEAYARVDAMIASDSPAVRLEAVRRLGFQEGAAPLAILTKAINGDDEQVAVAAAEALGREGSDEALGVLERALLERPPKIKAAAAFALKKSGTQRGVDFLRAQSRGHPDHDVQRICKLALGEDLHEH